MGVSNMFKSYAPEETAARNSAILREWNAGKSVNSVRRELAVTWYTIRKTLDAYKDQGVYVRERAPQGQIDWSGENRETLDRMFNAGASYAQLAKHFGCTIGVISGAIGRYGITRPAEINLRNLHWAKPTPEQVKARAEKRARSKAEREKAKQQREAEAVRKAELKRLREAPRGLEGQPIPPTKSRYVPTPEELASAKTLSDLGRRDCRFPLNEPAVGEGETTLFCAKPAKGSYCAWHAHVCTSGEQSSTRDLIRSVRRCAA